MAQLLQLKRPAAKAKPTADTYVGRLSPWADRPARTFDDIWQVRRQPAPATSGRRPRAMKESPAIAEDSFYAFQHAA